VSKLSIRQARERATAQAQFVLDCGSTIKATFPARTPDDARDAFVRTACKAVAGYLALLPMGLPRRRAHRSTKNLEAGSEGEAHRPSDNLRHSLIGDLFDAYTDARDCDHRPAVSTARSDPRGFRVTADAVLKAARLPPTTKRDLDNLKRLSSQFGKLWESGAFEATDGD